MISFHVPITSDLQTESFIWFYLYLYRSIFTHIAHPKLIVSTNVVIYVIQSTDNMAKFSTISGWQCKVVQGAKSMSILRRLYRRWPKKTVTNTYTKECRHLLMQHASLIITWNHKISPHLPREGDRTFRLLSGFLVTVICIKNMSAINVLHVPIFTQFLYIFLVISHFLDVCVWSIEMVLHMRLFYAQRYRGVRSAIRGSNPGGNHIGNRVEWIPFSSRNCPSRTHFHPM